VAAYGRRGELHEPAVRWLLAFCVCYAVYILANSAPVAAGADCGGYLGSAKLLSEGQLSTVLRTVPEYQPGSPWVYTPHGYMPQATGNTLVPTYPIGLPIHFAAAARVLGWHWGPLVIQAFGPVLSVLLCYALLRQMLLPATYSAVGAASFGMSPLLLSVAYIPMSDAWATVWCTAAIVCSFRGRKNARWAELAGAFAAIAIAVRPNNILIGPAMAIAVQSWRPLLRMALGAAPIFAGILWYNYLLYGSPFTTGYGSVADTLSRAHVLPSLTNYAKTLPFVLPLSFGCLLFLRARSRLPYNKVLALAAWGAGFMAFFSFYFFTPTHWWYLRFILPAFPALVAIGMLGWRAAIEANDWLRRRRLVLLTVLLVLASSTSVYWGVIKKINRSALEQGACADTAEWIVHNLPPSSIVACSYLSSAMYYYTDLPILRWEYVMGDEFSRLKASLATSQRPLYMVLRSFEVRPAFEQMPGRWKQVSAENYFTVWQLQPSDGH
jgi:hypothetical protein